MESKMFVVKRDGSKEEVSFDKVLRRIQKMSYGLTKVNSVRVSQKVLVEIVDGIHTNELDNLTGEICAMMIPMHPEYGTLASRIVTSNLQKETPSKFSECIEIMASNKDRLGNSSSLISDELVEVVRLQSEYIDSKIDDERDFIFDYFGFKTLERSYLMKSGGKIIERPQYMWMRVSLGIHGRDLERAFETYNLMSQGYFTHATPTLFNAGTPRPQLSSCFLLGTEDSVEGMYDTIKTCATISKWSGGIGVHMSNIRSNGSYIRGTNGTSSGLLPLLRVLNNTATHINQGGKRNGSIAVYLEPWHADVEDFLMAKRPHGAEEKRARDLFYALWMPDEFMRRVSDDGIWSLMCPDECPGLNENWGEKFDELYRNYESEGKYKKQISARSLWYMILESQIETGVPYLLSKDSANRKSNQQNLGTIKSSNLCVAPETLIYTDKGHIPIKELEGQTVNVWNGDAWSETKVIKTGENQKLINVKLSNGATITCTPYHKFITNSKSNLVKLKTGNYKYVYDTIKDAVRIDAKDLKIDQQLIKFNLNTIEGNELNDFKYPYTHGFFCGDGTYSNNGKTPTITLYGDKKLLIDKFDIKSASYEEDANGRLNIYLYYDINKKYDVPINATISNKIQWLAGLVDADGTILNQGNTFSIQIGSIFPDFLDKVRLLLITLGVHSKVVKMKEECDSELPDGKGGKAMFKCKAFYRLQITSIGIGSLVSLGFKPNRIYIPEFKPKQNSERFITVISIEDNERYDDTYCFNEPINHAGIFNGVCLGNCSEIIEYSDNSETAVCNLASIGLPKYIDKDGQFDYHKLMEAVRVITYNLNRVIDINFYPTPETKRSNMRHRPIGIGVQGLADVFAMMKLPFDSVEAKGINRKIFECIYYASVEESVAIAKRDGPYETFKGSPASDGKLQYHLWNDAPRETGYLDWDGLVGDVVKYGMRNSLLVAPMPTASTSQILGNNECFEPFTSNLYVRRVLSGEFVCLNKHLVRDLDEIGLWTSEMQSKLMSNGGKVQAIEEIPIEIKERYKTVWEIKQKVIIDMAKDRGSFVCQSQSMNLFFESPTADVLSSAHFYSWRSGLKTISYYIRSKPKAKVQGFSVEGCMTCTS
jgi:ribonucleoside-diphosphate reductase alpha chain